MYAARCLNYALARRWLDRNPSVQFFSLNSVHAKEWCHRPGWQSLRYGYWGRMANGGVFELLSSGSGWTEKDLYAFSFDFGENAVQGGLVIDPSNHLYGGTVSGGQTNFGIVYELADSPSGNWNETTLYNFTRATGGPYANLTLDHSGNLYGTAFGDGAYHRGSVFKLTPSPSGWIYTDLHDFDVTDGEHPVSSVLIDANSNLYGTTTAGGLYGDGVVWEITP